MAAQAVIFEGGPQMSVSDGSTPGDVDADVARLHELGYAQELHRRMGGFSNFAVSFTIISG